MPVKILILENRKTDFCAINDAISEKFRSQTEVFPKLQSDNPTESFHHFLENILQKTKFKEITDYYKNIDLFILDINLLNEVDALGTSFYNHLEESKYRNGDYKVIEVSSASSAIKSTLVPFVSKTNDFNYPYRLVDQIAELFPDLKLSSYRKQNFWNKLIEHGYLDGINKSGNWLDKLVRRIIHITITASFYILLLFSILFGTYKISTGFIELYNKKDNHLETQVLSVQKDSLRSINSISGTGKDADKNISDAGTHAQVKKHAEEMEIFKPAENIFLYLLPIFIVFGFYNYYKANTSIFLLNGNRETINEDKSTKSMNLTKMIFISTIISYVLIKCIEELFYGNNHHNHQTLIGAGVLLVILMGYFVLMYRKDH